MPVPRVKLDDSEPVERVRLDDDERTDGAQRGLHPTRGASSEPLVPGRRVSSVQYRWALYYTGPSQRDGIDAARRAGFKAGSAREIARQMRNNPAVMETVRELDEQRLMKIRYDGDKAARIHYVRAYHPRLPEFFESYTGCCRHCHGTNNEYQRSHAEFEHAYNKYMELTDKAKQAHGPFNPMGGSDFDPYREPNPDCPNCFGRGVGQVVKLRDFNNLSPEAHAMVSGVKMGKHGAIEELKFHDTAPSLQFLDAYQKLWLRTRDDLSKLDLEKMLLGLSVEELDALIAQERAVTDVDALEPVTDE